MLIKIEKERKEKLKKKKPLAIKPKTKGWDIAQG
jgi:hypothetical protein